MKRVSALIWPLLILGLLGCQPKSSTAFQPPENKSSAGSTEIAPEVKGANPGKAGSKTARVPDLPVDPKFFKISKPGEDGWKASDTQIEELGRSVDNALVQVKNTYGLVDTIFEVNGAQLVGRSDVKIKNSAVFNIEYYDNSTEAKRNRYIADGQNFVALFNENWTKKPMPPGKIVSQASPEELDDFLRSFTRSIFLPVIEGKAIFLPIFQKLKSDSNGKVIIEKVERQFEGKTLHIQRVLFSQPKNGIEIEVLIDDKRRLPITIRSSQKFSNGKTDKRFWTCQWMFGGSFAEKDFVIPTRS